MNVSADCDFYKNGEGPYECVVTSLVVTHPGTIVTKFDSKIQNITKMVIRNQDVHFFPHGLAVFSNLQELEISNCKMKEIKADDLKGLDKLKILNLANNCLDHLPDDLFKYVPQLERAYFNNNNIQLKLLEPLRNYECVDLQGNKVNIVL